MISGERSPTDMPFRAVYKTLDKQAHDQIRNGNLDHELPADFDYEALMPSDYFGTELVGVYVPFLGSLTEGMRRSVTTLKHEGQRVRELLGNLREKGIHAFKSPTGILPGGDEDQKRAMQRMYLLSLSLLSVTFEEGSVDANKTAALCYDLGLTPSRLDEITSDEAIEAYAVWHLAVSVDSILPWWRNALREEDRARSAASATESVTCRQRVRRQPL